MSLTFCDVSKALDRVWIRGLIYTIEKYGMRGDILEWFKTYLTDRKQKVILNNTESEIGCLYAGVPQGSVLAILFPIYINDIADHTDGICRLFADDTSLGHSSNDQQNLQDMINTDLSNIKKWSEDWLITFNNRIRLTLCYLRVDKEILTSSLGKPTYYLLTSINTWVLFSVLTVKGHDIFTTYYLRHPSKYVFYEN